MEDLAPLVQIRPTLCARALLVFLVACARSVFFNAGRWSEKFYQRVLIVLDLSCCRSGSELEVWATPVDDTRPENVIWLNPGCGASAHTSRLRKKGLVRVNVRICFSFCHAYAYGGSPVP